MHTETADTHTQQMIAHNTGSRHVDGVHHNLYYPSVQSTRDKLCVRERYLYIIRMYNKQHSGGGGAYVSVLSGGVGGFLDRLSGCGPSCGGRTSGGLGGCGL